MHPSLSQYNTEYTDYNEFYDYTEEGTATENPTDNVGTETKVKTLAHLYGLGPCQSLLGFLQPAHFHTVWSMIYYPDSHALCHFAFLSPHVPSLSFKYRLQM